MSSHHNQDNHSNEAKPVSFRTPLILGLVTVLIILLAVSTCDNKKHETAHAEEAHKTVSDEHSAIADTLAKPDTTAAHH